jgi:branched-subunit amino acid aminotransferase/4-amino-4-deoxychorismate lyase
VAIVWLNGELVREEEARVPALDRGVLWGYGLFETMRSYGGRLWAFDDHYERLRRGGEVVDLAVPDPAALESALHETLEANELGDAGVRVTITAGTGPPDPQAEPTGPPNVLATAWPLRDYARLYEEGVALVTIAGGGRPLAGVKTTSYAVSVAGRVIARRAGADDALFVGAEGRVLEATGSNLFAVRAGGLVTPPLSEAVLPGVTRRHVLAVAEQIGLETTEESLSLDDLFSCDEVVLTSSLREVYPVRSIDGRDVGRGGVAAKLRDAYHAAVLSSLE